MAQQILQFTMTFGSATPPRPPSLTTQFWNFAASPPAWATYIEPNYNQGVGRSGGPGQGGAGSYPVASASDSIQINLVGPTGWAWPADTALQVIFTQANSPNPNQGFTPVDSVWYALGGTMQSDGVTMVFNVPDSILAGPSGRQTFYRYELTIAFRACAPSSTTPVYFSIDPEMDVMGN